MNISNYAKRKKSGAVQVIKLRGGFAFVQRVWDTETGDEKEASIVSIKIETLEDARNSFQDQIDNVNLLIDDIKALKDAKPL